MTDEEIAARVGQELAGALGRPLERVRPESFLKKDLGAESIDLIDLTFRFEKVLGRPLVEQEIFRSALPDGDVTVAEVVAAVKDANRRGLPT